MRFKKLTNNFNCYFQSASLRHLNDNDRVAGVSTTAFELTENGVRLSLTVIDTPGFGERLNSPSCWEALVEEIRSRNSACLAAEMATERKTRGAGTHGRLGVLLDPLVHACFYFVAPTGHPGLRTVDLEAMRHLHDKVSFALPPLFAKFGTNAAGVLDLIVFG